MLRRKCPTKVAKLLLVLPIVGLTRSLCSSHAKPPSFLSLTPLASLNTELSLADEVLHLLHSPHSQLEPSLDALLPIFTPHLVSSVLEPSSSPNPPPVASAFRFFNWASRRPHLRSRYSYSLLVSLLSSHPSAFDSAWMSLHLMRRDAVPVAPSSFEALIYAYDRCRLLGKAVEAFDLMPEFGCRPTIFVYNVLISALVKRGLFLLAMGVYNRMRKSGCNPNRSTFTILIGAHCQDGRSGDALHLFDEMSRGGFPPDTMVYNLVIRGLCRARRMDDALGLLDAMRRNGVPRCAVTCGSLVDGFGRAGKVDVAFRLVKEFAEEGLALGLYGYTSLINGLFACGRFAEACQLFGTMGRENVPSDCVIYTTMIKGYADNGHVKEAFAFLGEMIKRGIEPDSFCYNTLMKGLCDVGDVDEAFSVMLEISRDPGFLNSETYNILICGLCNKGMVAEAQQIFEEMGNKGCFPTVVTFNTLISGLCKFKKVEEAHTMFCKMDTPTKPSLFLRIAHLESSGHSLHEQVERHCKLGHVLQAYNLLQLLADSGAVQPDISTYTILIHNLCKDKKLDEALKLLKDAKMRGLVPDAVTYGALISGFQSNNRFEEALVFIDDMFKSGCTPSRPLYYIIMRALCKMKNVTRAVYLWLSYISKSNELSAEEADYIAMAKKHFEVGSVGEMVRCLIEMDIQWHTHYSSPYGIWLSGFCEVDKLDEAYQILAVLHAYKIEVPPSSCASLFQALFFKRRFYEAINLLFYTMGGAYKIDSHHGKFLLQKLSNVGRNEAVAALAAQMGKSGYNLDANLERKTRVLLDENAIT